MRMSTKLVLVFSIVIFALVAINTAMTISNDTKALMDREQVTLSVLAERIAEDLDQTITIMEYGLDEMTQDSEFMAALEVIHRLGEDGENTPEYRKAQTTLSSKLYQQPLNESFYCVNVMTDEGFILSSHFQRFDVIESYSDEVRSQYARMPWLIDDSFSLTTKQVITPHPDPWDVYQHPIKSTAVFSVATNAIYHGKKIGYLEVNLRLDDLEQKMLAPALEGFQAAAIFEDRQQEMMRDLYRADENTIVYENVTPGQLTICKDADGHSYAVTSFVCRWLDLTVYAAHDMSMVTASIRDLVRNHVLLGLGILLAAIVAIVLLSNRLTQSVSRLTRKISHTSSDTLLTESKLLPGTIRKVTHQSDKEVRALENSFDDLLISLQASTRTEMELRETTLRSQLNALQAQINPHFIYNTLNIISAKSMEAGAEEVIDICDQFAQMLRYSTDLRSKTATLREEIDNAHNYLLLAKARYEDKLTYEIDVPKTAMNLIMPKLSLQPMVENAISHGYQRSKGSIHIQVTGHMDEMGNLRLVIRDNGAGFDDNVLLHLQSEFARIENGEFTTPENTTAHIGLVNTYRRLFFFSERNIRMTLRNDGGAVIELIVNHAKEVKA